jgi:hypothetical protein
MNIVILDSGVLLAKVPLN